MADTPLVGFAHFFEPMQPVVPEPLQERTQICETFGARAIVASRSLFTLVEQARFPEHREVL